MVEVTVGPMEAGKKVHRLVRQLLPGVPLSGVYKMIRTGRVKRNGKRAKSDDVVEQGDVIRLYMAETDFAEVSKAIKKFGGVSTDVDVVFEDERMLVVNKPVGLLVHGAGEEHKDTLVNRVLAYLHGRGELEQKMFTPSPLHRLDRNTSGLVLFGKNGATARELSADMESHAIRKWYLAIVSGRVPASGEISAPVARDAESNITRVVAGEAGAKDALTRYQRIVAVDKSSVVKVELVSGRTHQIRAHFAHLRHPLLGDVKYGGGYLSDDPAENHQWLHAAGLVMRDGRRFYAPPPTDFVDVLRREGYTDGQVESVIRYRA